MNPDPGLLLRGGVVVDGTGAPPVRADVRVRTGMITEIERDLAPEGESVVDASGAYVTPGFIDSHTHYDPTIFWDPSCDPMPQHGVTTLAMGNCSLSLAPVRPEHVPEMERLFSFIEDIPPESFASGVPWDWQTYPEYRRRLEGIPLALNVCDLVGHTPLRLWVLGDEAWERTATDDEIAQMAALLEEALVAGAAGFSSSTSDRDAHDRLVPSVLADDRELAALVEVVGRQGKLLEYVPRVRGFNDDFLADVDRFANLCGRFGVPLTYNGISCDTQWPGRFAKALEQAEALAARGIEVYPQITTRPIDTMANWSGGMSFSFLPSWNAVVQASGPDKRAMLTSAEWRQQARAEWDTVKSPLIPNWAPERIRLLSVTRPELAEWVGRSLADLAADRGQHPSDALADWVMENDLRPGIMASSVRNDDEVELARVIAHPRSLVSNSDAGAHLNMFCGAGDGTRLITHFVRQRGDLSIEQAVHQLTGRQASLFRIPDRGVLRPGQRADPAVFSLAELVWSEPVIVADLPAAGTRQRRPEGGYRLTVVGGVVTQRQGALTGERPGRLLHVA